MMLKNWNLLNLRDLYAGLIKHLCYYEGRPINTCTHCIRFNYWAPDKIKGINKKKLVVLYHTLDKYNFAASTIPEKERKSLAKLAREVIGDNKDWPSRAVEEVIVALEKSRNESFKNE